MILKKMKINTHKIEPEINKMAAIMEFRRPYWNYKDTLFRMCEMKMLVRVIVCFSITKN